MNATRILERLRELQQDLTARNIDNVVPFIIADFVKFEAQARLDATVNGELRDEITRLHEASAHTEKDPK